MGELNAEGRRMIDAVIEVYEPSPAACERMRGAIERSVDAGTQPRYADAPAPRRSQRVTWVVALAVGAAAAVVALAVSGWSPLVMLSSPDETKSEAAYEREDASREGTVQRSPRRSNPVVAADPPEPADVAAAADASSVEPAAPQSPAKAARSKSVGAKPRPVPALGDQLEVLQRARAAMDAKRYTEVMKLTRQYRRAYPRGAFVQEAGALRVLAQCHAGRSDAKTQGRRFLARYPASLTADRIRRVCDLN